MIWFYISVGLAVTAIVLATIVMTLIWERQRVYRQQYQDWCRGQQDGTPGIWVRNSVNLG